MSRQSPKVDAYIENAAPFAKPILLKIRRAFHEASPEIEETIKWGVPHFDYKGVLGGMAAFKQHVNWGFWKAKLMKGPKGAFADMGDASMGTVKATSEKELPPHKVLVEYVREAMRLNDEGVKIARPKKGPVTVPDLPDDLAAELSKNKKARETFEKFAPSHKREYVQWIVEAKQEATRKKRLAQAVEWMAEGKPRNWKYMK